MISKKLFIPIAAVAIGGASIFGVTQVRAQANGQTLVQMIAQKFGLDQSQVQSVFDQFKSQRKATMQQRLEDRLSKAISDGKITAAQKQAILDEIAKLQSKYDPKTFKTMTQDQRRQTIQKRRDEIQTWAKEQDIDPVYLMPGFGMGHRMWKGK